MGIEMGNKIVIIGGGPAGLGAAWRLWELGHNNWELFEAEDYPGGLATSFVDEKGFTWDIGGHVAFSHYEYFDRLMNCLLSDTWLEHIREAWVWMRCRFIAYPLQNNIWRLPDEDLITCLEGLLEVLDARDRRPPRDFDEWMLKTFGRGLTDVFMRPYNFKVWAHKPEEMNVQWVGERVAPVDLARILRNLVHHRDEVSWGPNATFLFPLRCGTGAIWRAMADRLPAERVHYGRRVTVVDPARRTVRFGDGEEAAYDVLISTMPLDELLRLPPGPDDLGASADGLRYSSTHVIGVGLAGQVPEHLATKCWIYFPEPDVPFYRATVFSNYSPNNVPDHTKQWSLMAEVSESPCKPVDPKAVADESVRGLIRSKLISDVGAVVNVWHKRVEHGYPIPFLGRDDLLEKIQQGLYRRGILSRGRFGAWKYEVANMDHSVMQGVEAIDHVLFGTEETTLRFPSIVNVGKNAGRRFLGSRPRGGGSGPVA